jgi:hypothetical protein
MAKGGADIAEHRMNGGGDDRAGARWSDSEYVPEAAAGILERLVRWSWSCTNSSLARSWVSIWWIAGQPNGLKISHGKYLQLGQIGAADGGCPAWLVDAAARAWNLEISGRAVNHTVIVRSQSPYGYGRAS